MSDDEESGIARSSYNVPMSESATFVNETAIYSLVSRNACSKRERKEERAGASGKLW